MKKLYTSALAALCVIGASAEINGAQIRTDVVAKKNVSEQALQASRSMTNITLQKIAGDKVMSRAGEDETTEYSIEGIYSIGIGDYYYEGGAGSIEEVAEITREDNQITISSEYFMSDVIATYDEEGGTITFKNIPFGSVNLTTGGVAYVRFEPFYWDYDAEEIVAHSYTATFDATTGEITFPADHGFSWAAYEDSRYKMFQGYFDVFDVEGMAPYVEDNTDPNEGWTNIGNATFVDAWITPSYKFNDGTQVNPSDYPIEATLQQNDEIPTLYRLLNPYYDQNWPIVSMNQSNKTGYIVFDIADPDHVIVKAGYPAGFKNSNGEFYVYGILGWQIWTFGSSWDDSYLPELIAYMEEDDMPFDTYADGVVTVNMSVFDTSAKCENAYSWNNNPYVVSTITFPSDDTNGIIDIEANDNAPVEYFNLQGVRVDNPAAGQFVIKRQGSNVTKTILR